MGAREVANLAPDRAHLGAHATVEADALVENHVAHCLLLHIVVVAAGKGNALGISLFLCLVGRFRESCDELVKDGLEAVLTLVLRLCRLCKSVALVIAEILYGSLESLVLDVVRIVPRSSHPLPS